MRIKILKQCMTPLGPFNEGDITDIPDDIAQVWLRSGLAEPLLGKVETAMLDQGEMAIVHSVTDKAERKRQQTNERVKRYRERQALQVKQT
jgi:hypothetical protein